MNSPDLIRITKEDATSEHVDDLLKRQMSLRGETGVTRSSRRTWYLRSWFILGVAGLLGGIAAWGLLEPIFYDLPYVRGPISAIAPDDPLPEYALVGGEQRAITVSGRGSITVKGERIYLCNQTKEMPARGGTRLLPPDALRVGQTVGVYATYLVNHDGPVPIASFIQTAPRPGPDSTQTLAQINARTSAVSFIFFGVVAGLVGLFIGAADGLVCRLPVRALLAGGVGLLVGLAGGFISNLFAGLIYTPLNRLAMDQMDVARGLTTFGFILQMGGRAMAWAMAGCAMGLGQGIALRSKRLLTYGLLGGVIGGLLGGLLFDPIDFLLVGADRPGAMWSRLAGLAVIGASVGGMMGIVELLARDAWLRMTQGPLAGKEFVVFKDLMTVGSSPRADIYLFNDKGVAPEHAILRTVGDECEIEARDTVHPVLINNRPIHRTRLRHGDSVTVGRTMFVFQRRKS